MKTKFNLILLSLILISDLLYSQKKVIAVSPFQVPQDMEYRYDFHGTGLIDKIPTLLEADLFKTDKFEIVERSRLDEIIDEQILSNSGLTENTLDFGKLKGVDYFVMGKITGFSAEVDNVEVKLGLKTMYVGTQHVSITLTVKLVDVTTAKVISVITEEGIVKEKGRPRGDKIYKVSKDNIEQAAKDVTKLVSIKLTEKM
jgi:curli biogenesis system outer membrane secretion channel CsgG